MAMQPGQDLAVPVRMKWPQAVHALALTAWAGALWTVGYVVAPVLFATLDKISAGNVAARLFSLVTWIGVVCALILIVLRGWVLPGARDWALWAVVLMLALAVAGHWGIVPLLADLRAKAAPLPVMESAERGAFALWHGVSAVLYLIQSLLAAALVLPRK